MRTLAYLLAITLAPPFVAPSAGDDVLNEARRHYDAAAYDEALAVLARADRSSRPQIVEVEQYRAFCYIALGRMNDAENAVAALVEADPLYLPTASPRVLSVVQDIRRQVLPAVARRQLEAGRTAYMKKDLEKARGHFQMLLRMLADPAMQGRAETADLRTLADGFVTLLAAAPPPAPVVEPPRLIALESNAPALPIAPPPPPVVVPAVAIREVLPSWTPDASTARFAYAGSMRVIIGVDGRVKSATIQDSSHPSYDVRLLHAARSWLYKPATRGGEPVEFEKVLEIRLRPPS